MKLIALKGKSLTTTVYRGYASAKYLSEISEADEFDQEANPEGTQRGLNKRHAREANMYAAGKGDGRKERIWPEVILNVRVKSVVKLSKPDKQGLVTIHIFDKKIKKTGGRNPQISRVDGNHRLFYADGIRDGRTEVFEIEELIPFCLTIGLNKHTESSLFTDINATPKKMNTSHLAHLAYRNVAVAKLKAARKPLWMAERMLQDPDSPFYKRVYLGGKRPKGKKYMLSLTLLERCVKMTLNRSRFLQRNEVSDNDALRVLQQYWKAVSTVFRDAWTNTKDYKLLSSVSMYAMSMIAADVIDRAFSVSTVNIEKMKELLGPVARGISWEKDEFEGHAGLAGAKVIHNDISRLLAPEVDISKAIASIK